MKLRRMVGYVLLGALMAVPALRAASSNADLDWIGDLPGVSVLAKETGSGYSRIVYTVSGSPDGTLERVREGLSEQGWTIQKSIGGSVLGIVTGRTLVAKRGDARAQISLSQVTILLNHLVVELTGGGGARTSTPSGGGASTTSAPAPSRRPSARTVTNDCGDGGDLFIKNSASAITVAGHCDDVFVSGSSNDITFEGDCRDLFVSGSANSIRLEGLVNSIHASGDDNTVTWSAARKGKGPSVANSGQNNTIRRH